MALLDPYSLCPCGSKQKYKWCCQKAESFAVRVERALQNQHPDQAMIAVEEGLKKERDNFWLLNRKAMIHEERNEPAAAREAIQRILAKMPDHVGARIQLVQYALQFDGTAAGASEFQRAMLACKPEDRPNLAGAAQLVGVMLARDDYTPAALMHLELGGADSENAEPVVRSTYVTLRGDPVISPWLKNTYELLPTPEELDDEKKGRFEEAIKDVVNGLWSQAAARFELLSGEGVAGADYNLGLCRLWMADNAGAVEALRRHIAQLGPTPEAVDLEVLCQLSEPITGDDVVERVQLVWELKNREALLNALRQEEAEQRTIHDEGKSPIDPDDPDSEEVDWFALLDRPLPEARPGLTANDLPKILGRVLVAQQIVILDTFDDSQLEALKDRFTEQVGNAIPPAHPRTKVIGEVSRVSRALQSAWIIPQGMDKAEVDRIRQEERKRVYKEVWPETPMPFLGGRTPRQAAQAGDAEIPLRAALCQFEIDRSIFQDDFKFESLREEFGIEPEPKPDLETTDIGTLHLARLHRLPAQQLSDDDLFIMYLRARLAMLPKALEDSSKVLINRSAFLERRQPIERYSVFSDLANLTLSFGKREEALALVDRGRRDEPIPHRAENAPRWDMLHVRLRARTEPLEAWVPELAVVLERHREGQTANTIILTNLLDMGLVQMTPNPEDSSQMLLDSRRLMAVLSRYGPRVTTAQGTLGASAAKPEIWTPDRASGSTGGVWTPGSANAPPQGQGQGQPGTGEKPGLYLPGQR